MVRPPLRACRLLALGLAACGACQGPPPWPAGAADPGRGVFPSSQIKPLLAAPPQTPDAPRALDRSERQAAYFAGPPDPAAKAALLGPPDPPTPAGVRDLHAGPLPHLELTLQQGQRLLLETRQLSPGADTVLHLLWGASGQQVAFDDDGGETPGSSRLSYTAERQGRYLALLRPYATGDHGSCDLLVDGTPRLERAAFGGSSLAVAGQIELAVVLLNDRQGHEPWPPAPRAATDPLLLLLDPQTGALLGLDDDSGVELGARLVTPEQPAVALLGAYQAAAAGSARLVQNDVAAGDADGDGLGDGLEQALCLCSRQWQEVCGFACSLAQTPQDSDGDGLSDADELLGVEHPLFPQLLPRWGADPRHKDLLLEIDLADWTDAQAKPPERHLGRPLAPEAAHAAARVFARLSEMQNPDGLQGIALHLDLGQPCGPHASGIDAVCGDFCALGQDGLRRCGQSIVAGPEDRRQNLAPGRRHLFHLALADCLIAGSAPGAAADHLTYDCDRFTALVHELGHNLGLSHQGAAEAGGGNCKPNYPSLMNYAYADRFAGGKELRFSEGALVATGALDPSDLDETARLGQPGADVSFLAARPFHFQLHDCLAPGQGCQVDFNRDGQLDPSVRAFLSPMPNYGFVCEGEHANALFVEDLPELAVQGGVAALELARRRPDGSFAPALHVFAVARDAADRPVLQVSYTHQHSGSYSPWLAADGPTLRPDTQVAALTWQQGEGQTAQAFVCRAGEQPILQAALIPEGQLSALTPVPGQPPGLRARDVSVIQQGADVLLLVRDERPGGGDQVYATRRTPAGWSGVFQPLQAEGLALRSWVTPALTLAPNGRVYLITADPAPPPGSGPAGRLHLYSATDLFGGLTDEELEGLTFADGVLDHNHELWSRPALAFVPHLDGAGQPLPGGRGYLALWWVRDTRVRFLWSWGLLDETTADFRLGRWHHYEAEGFTDAIAGASPALVLRDGTRLAALLPQSARSPGQVRHVPHADGIPPAPLPLQDFDDRPVIRQNLCRGLNWDCPGRCFDLRRPCSGDEGGPVLTELRCDLPHWQEEVLLP